ncbi:MAG: response regulator [Anaerolineales bacterium]|nr:response regulator [Anaerolineales bacterium]
MSSKPRILVVDDNRALVRVIEGILQKEGFGVLTAFDGVEGLRKAREEKPALIILDIIMPEMDGYEICRQLQSDPDTAAIPVLMLTVKGRLDVSSAEDERRFNAHVEERVAGFEAGALEFLTKPVTAKELVKRVKGALWISGWGLGRGG